MEAIPGALPQRIQRAGSHAGAFRVLSHSLRGAYHTDGHRRGRRGQQPPLGGSHDWRRGRAASGGTTGRRRQPRRYQHRLLQPPALRPCGLEPYARTWRRPARHLPQRSLRRPPRRLGGLPASRGDGAVPSPLGPGHRPAARPWACWTCWKGNALSPARLLPSRRPAIPPAQ